MNTFIPNRYIFMKNHLKLNVSKNDDAQKTASRLDDNLFKRGFIL